jgi:hypothetical protein
VYSWWHSRNTIRIQIADYASTEVIGFTYIEKLLVEWKLRWTFELKNKSSEPTNLGLAVFRHKPHFPRDNRVNGRRYFKIGASELFHKPISSIG